MIEKLPTDYNVRTICNLKNMSKVAVEISSHRTTKLERERERVISGSDLFWVT